MSKSGGAARSVAERKASGGATSVLPKAEVAEMKRYYREMPTPKLLDAYKNLTVATFNSGQRTAEHANAAARELQRRGVHAVPNIFGPIPIRADHQDRSMPTYRTASGETRSVTVDHIPGAKATHARVVAAKEAEARSASRTLEQHTVAELKAMARERGVQVGGTKSELIARLRAPATGAARPRSAAKQPTQSKASPRAPTFKQTQAKLVRLQANYDKLAAEARANYDRHLQISHEQADLIGRFRGADAVTARRLQDQQRSLYREDDRLTKRNDTLYAQIGKIREEAARIRDAYTASQSA